MAGREVGALLLTFVFRKKKVTYTMSGVGF